VPTTSALEANAGDPEQVPSSGPNSWKVIFPLGAVPLSRNATSLTVPPTSTDPDAALRRSGRSRPTTTVSAGSPHAVGPAGSLSESPEYSTTQRYVPAPTGRNVAEW
jgi:hypothetical protein